MAKADGVRDAGTKPGGVPALLGWVPKLRSSGLIDQVTDRAEPTLRRALD